MIINLLKKNLLVFAGLYLGMLATKNIIPDQLRTYTTQLKNHPLIDLDETTPRALQDLTKIALALEKYKEDHHQYPVSKSNDRDWSLRITIDGQLNPEWIKGLSPGYISDLPRDSRLNDEYFNQYAYKSDGVSYKLVAQFQDDCREVEKIYPAMIAYNCAAYGYWSNKAVYW